MISMAFFGTNIVTLVLPLCVALLAPDNLPQQVGSVWNFLFDFGVL